MTNTLFALIAFVGVLATSGGETVSAPGLAETLGPFGRVGGGATQTDVPKAPIAKLINAGLALTTDGDWVRWQQRWNGRYLLGADQFERAGSDTSGRGWNIPATATLVPMPGAIPGEMNCRLLGAALANGRRLGAWNCDSAPGTILGAPSKNGEIAVLARLGRRFQAMSAEPTMHSGASRILLAAYYPSISQFDILELTWPQTR